MKQKKIEYFVVTKAKFHLDMNGTNLVPNKVMWHSGKFEEVYQVHLESLLFAEELSMKDIHPLMMLAESIDREEYPVRITIGTTLAERYRVVKALNAFFKEHEDVILMYYRMYADHLTNQRVKLLKKEGEK